MGKGAYNGGSSIIQAATGYVSTSRKNKISKGPLTAKEKRARKINALMQSNNIVTLEEAKSLGIPFSLWKKRLDKNISNIELDIKNCRSEIKALEKKLDKLRQLLKKHEGYRRSLHHIENDYELSGSSE